MQLKAQTSVSFQHLGNATFQNNLINPSLIPEGKIFVGLPVLSGVHLHLNNKVSYNQAFTKEATQTTVDGNKILGELQGQNMLSVKANINLLHIGYRLKTGPLLSLTINERIDADFLYPKEVVDYVWGGGNLNYLNKTVNVSKVGLTSSHFREFGLGLAAPLTDQLTVGIRGKFLVGFANASLPGNMQATLFSNGEAFQIDAKWKNAVFRTSGLDIYQQEKGFGSSDLTSHLIMNGNKGVAIDVGGTYHLNRYYTITGSIVDLGFINWKENIRNQALSDTSFTYNGVDIAKLGDIKQTLQDSLFDKFDTKENTDAYKSWLPITGHGSWIYHYNSTTDFYATVGTRLIQRQIKMLYGGGITKKFGRSFTGSISATKLPQQFFNAGAAFSAKAGPVQIYMAVDQIINFSVPDAKSIDFRFGLNFAIGKHENRGNGGDSGQSSLSKGPINGARGLDTNVFLGNRVKTKKREGIYSIIKRQRKRELRTKQSQRDNSVRKRSLNGRTGKKNAKN